MNKKILMGLIILGVIFIGSATYALFNENILLDVSSDIQTNDSSLPNNQHNIQNNQTNNIANVGNSNLSFNNIVNVVLRTTGDIDYQNKIKKELLFDYVENNGVNEYFYVLHIDSNNLNSGYISCPDCGFFIPIGNVSNLIPEEYLCNCSVFVSSSAIPTYSEENILNFVYYDINDGKTFQALNKNGLYSSPLNVSLNNQNSISESSADVMNSSNGNSDVDVPAVEEPKNPRINPHLPHPGEFIYPYRNDPSANLTYYGDLN